ncbi:MAG: RdgB/HAM1 family non-canonical purine NTP pyrophosphatase [Ignavibacteriae bacterium]|nr:RdgB/HAM1 family non-canonical purine NTP pyrophosphatase [Ignavibacteriota bacterium]
MDSLVIATRNRHKTREIAALLAHLPVRVRDLSEFPDAPEVEEDGETLEANALKKARSAHAHTGLPALADDTGLEVFYLLGAPGVYSARYAGEQATYDDNNRKLLDAMKQVPARKRDARFRCVVAFVYKGEARTFEGAIDGHIGIERRGTNGFGYDPVFYPAGDTLSYAEMSDAEKNAISHRARAVSAFARYLEDVNGK